MLKLNLKLSSKALEKELNHQPFVIVSLGGRGGQEKMYLKFSH
jgi:hypothetical protein